MQLIKYIDGTYNSFLAKIFLFPLYITSLIYGLIIRIRFFFYSNGIFKIKELPCKVISIGNITVGGSGKTPMAIHLARKLTEMGKRVVILSRGYKSKTKGAAMVSDGKDTLLNADESGDEPFLIANKIKGVPVIIGRDRYRAGLFAVDRFSPDVIILDDGFQHIRLKRDKDICLVDSIRKFGSGHLLPWGILRETVDSLNRADYILISGNEDEETIRKIKTAGITIPIKSFKYKPLGLINLLDNSTIELNGLKNKNILAFAGIANPASFFKTLEELGAVIKKYIVFPDHHKYTSKDIEGLKRLADGDGIDYIIATEKDGVKIKGLLRENTNVYALSINIDICDEQEFLKAICE